MAGGHRCHVLAWAAQTTEFLVWCPPRMVKSARDVGHMIEEDWVSRSIWSKRRFPKVRHNCGGAGWGPQDYIVCWGLYWGPAVLGNYHVQAQVISYWFCGPKNLVHEWSKWF